MSLRSLLLSALGLALTLGSLVPTLAAGQQVLVDDPASVRSGAAQLEAWHSSEESWIAPAVRVHPRLELAGGVAFLQMGVENRRTVKYNAEGKLLLLTGSSHPVGVAAVGGVGLRQFGLPREHPSSVYGYGILSQSLLPGQLTAYQNVGWTHEENGPYRLTWGARLDWTPLDQFTLIGEVHGEGRADPSVQVALRTVLVPGRVEMDLSLTHTRPFDQPSTWATLGLTFMSSPLY